jgi:hypothetical protein
MQRLFLFLAAFWLLMYNPLVGTAQTDDSEVEEVEAVEVSGKKQKKVKVRTPREDMGPKVTEGKLTYSFGLFGNLTTGVTQSFALDALGKDLQPAFGSEFEFNGFGTQYGGQVYVLFLKRLMLGFQGNGYSYHVAESDTGSARLRSGLIGGNLGFLLFNKDINVKFSKFDERQYRLLLFPYVGYSAGTSTLRVQNFTTTSLSFGDDFENPNLERISEQKFKSNLGLLEVGIGTRVMGNDKGGIMLGLELGGYFALGDNAWENDATGKVVTGVKNHTLNGMYARFTIGGGFLKIGTPKVKGNDGPTWDENDGSTE